MPWISRLAGSPWKAARQMRVGKKARQYAYHIDGLRGVVFADQALSNGHEENSRLFGTAAWAFDVPNLRQVSDHVANSSARITD